MQRFFCDICLKWAWKDENVNNDTNNDADDDENDGERTHFYQKSFFDLSAQARQV